MSPPMDISLVRIDSMTMTSPGPASSKAAYSGDSSPPGFFGHQVSASREKSDSDGARNEAHSGIHSPDVGHINVSWVMTIAREDVDDGSRVDHLELLDGLTVEDVIGSGFNDGQFSVELRWIVSYSAFIRF